MLPSAAAEALAARFGPRFSARAPDRDQHATSESHFPPTPPWAVVWPETTQEVADLVRIAAAHRLPLIGWGAGTSLEAQALAVQGGISVDFARMAALRALWPEDRLAEAEPGMTRSALNAALRGTGLMFPVDPGADATIGGMAMTRASGTTAVRYGTMRDNVAGFEAVLASGEVIRTGTRARKSAAGYDLTALLVGSEGTLALVTAVTLRLHPQPEAIVAATCAFPDVASAVAAAEAAMALALPLARIELMDAAAIAAVNARDGLGLPETPHLMLEFHGSPAQVAEDAARMGGIAAEAGGAGFVWAGKAEERTRLWAARHRAHWSILATRPGARAIVTDVCVPPSRLAEAIAETQADIAASGLPGPILGHVGDGNFHAILLIDGSSTDERAAAGRLAARMAERALRLGGTVTGEHGIGTGKRGYMPAEHGGAWAVMAAVKRALDPDNILNPGKLVPDP